MKNNNDWDPFLYKPFPTMTITTSNAVCIIVENLAVPLDRRVWCEAQALRDAGYVVSVISPKGKPPYTKSYELLDGIHIYRHRAWEAKSTLGYLFEYGLALVAELYLVFKVFLRTRFRVLQGCNPPDNLFLLALMLKPLGVRFVFDHHDLSPELFEAKFGGRQGLFGALSRFAEKCSFRVANVSLATNESFKEVAILRGGKLPENVFVVRNCPDLTKLRSLPIRKEADSRRPYQIVYVGFMGRQDGLDILLDAIEHIVKTERRDDARFTLVGGGSMIAELKSIVEQKALQKFVTFTGQVTHDEVVRHLAAADIGVAPDPKTSMNDKSTMIKIFEYMALGLPIVQFDLKEGRRSAGDASLYAQPNDPIDFASKITMLMDSADLRGQLAGVGRRRVEESLNWESEKRNLLLAYKTVLQN